jgi:hypothetical protein
MSIENRKSSQEVLKNKQKDYSSNEYYENEFLLGILNKLKVLTGKREQITWLVENSDPVFSDGMLHSFHAYVLIVEPIDSTKYLIKHIDNEYNTRVKKGNRSISLIYKSSNNTFSVVKVGEGILKNSTEFDQEPEQIISFMWAFLASNGDEGMLRGSQNEVSNEIKKWINEHEAKLPKSELD